MSASSVSLQGYHAAAISLNNTGVSLLERKCFKQAIQIFKNAVFAMKIVTSISNGSSAEQAASSWPKVQAMLKEASQSLFHPEPDVHPSCSSCLRALTLDGSCTAAVQQLLRQNEQDHGGEPSSSTSTSPNKFLIRIESNHSFQNPSMSFDVDSSIILYNFGIAFECMAHMPSNSNDLIMTTECRKNALNLAAFSYSVFLDNVWTLVEPCANNNNINNRVDCHLSLLILFLFNLIELTSQSGRETDAQTFYWRLIEASEVFMGRKVHLEGVFGRWWCHSTAAAA